MTYEDFRNRYKYNPRTDLLGEGAYGKVFRGFDTQTNATVAIKTAPIHSLSDTYSLLYEFDILQNVANHTNVALYDECYRLEVDSLGLYDFGISDYYPLGSLDKLIRSTQLSDADKHEIALGILEGMLHLHQAQIVHRDLKPRNILIQKLRSHYIPKIADFGLGKSMQGSEQSYLSQSFKGGTLNYSYPEQLKGEPIRRNTDIWAFGVILYELYTGEVPYRIDNTSETTLQRIYQQMQQQELPASAGSISPAYAKVIRKSLVVDPTRRYGRVEDVLADFWQIAKQPSASQPVVKPQQPELCEPIIQPNSVIVSNERKKNEDTVLTPSTAESNTETLPTLTSSISFEKLKFQLTNRILFSVFILLTILVGFGYCFFNRSQKTENISSSIEAVSPTSTGGHSDPDKKNPSTSISAYEKSSSISQLPKPTVEATPQKIPDQKPALTSVLPAPKLDVYPPKTQDLKGTVTSELPTSKPDAGLNSSTKALANLALTDKDNNNITAKARRMLTYSKEETFGLNSLMNYIASDRWERDELDLLISQSYSPGTSKIFDNRKIIIEDDINPTHTSASKTEDLTLDVYLTNLNLYYSKWGSNGKPSISFTDIKPMPVQQNGNSIYIKVYFKSTFQGHYINRINPNSPPYETTERVIEMRAEKPGRYWQLYITRIGFK
jgi:serine/threonine protein kinase